jgi:sialate O-acetylesterase
LIPHKTSSYPLQDFDGKADWTKCTPETAAKFSAVAYFFGREIAQKQNVTIGLVDSTWGGTPGEAWVSMDGLASDASLMPVFATWANMANTQADVPAMLAAEKAEDEAAKRANQPPPEHHWHPDPKSYDPSFLYNAMVAPATPYGIKGVIWYQGETNSSWDRAPLYHRVFSTLITDWRRNWGVGEFPFLFVQISSFKSDNTEGWPLVRQAQFETLSLQKTGMAVTIDVGDPDNVHPADKQTVGHRLALIARAETYGEPLEYSGPLFRQAVVERDCIRVWFTHAKGLTSHGDLQGFEIAGPDRHYVPGTATIDGDTVLIKADGLKEPAYVRYAWANAVTATLFNADGLPASPFNSDPDYAARANSR